MRQKNCPECNKIIFGFSPKDVKHRVLMHRLTHRKEERNAEEKRLKEEKKEEKQNEKIV